MNQHSTSNTTPELPRPWLLQHYAATRQRTIDLVKMTVDRLIQDGQTVTIEAICRRSQQFDPQGKGIKKLVSWGMQKLMHIINSTVLPAVGRQDELRTVLW